MQSQHFPLRLFTRGLRRTKAASDRRALLGVTIVALGAASCGHAWDDYDPRLGSGAAGTAGSGGNTSTGGSTTTGGNTSAGGDTNTGGSTSAGGDTNTGGSMSTGGNTSTGGSTTTGTVCDPGSKIGCYSGPGGTQDVGICKPGTQTCDAQGNGYGACVGEVTPLIEDCALPTDDDCDGSPDDHCALWSKAFGDPGSQYANAVAVDPNGNVVVVGAAEETINFGGGDLNAQGSLSAFVVKFTSSGAHLWSKLYGSDQDQEATSVTTDANGNVFVAGNFNGTISFNGGQSALTSAGSQDAFVVKLDSNGNMVWAKAVSGVGAQTASAVILDGSGNIYVAGAFAGSANFVGAMGASNGGMDGYLMKLTNTGDLSWVKTFGGPEDDAAIALSGRVASIIVTGYFRQTIDLGEGLITSGGGQDIFLAKYNSAGAVTFTEAFSATGDQRPRGVVSDIGANVFLFGEYSSSVKIGGGSVPSAGGLDLFLAKTNSDGAPQWLETFGDAADQGAGAIAIDSGGSVAFAAHHRGTVDYGGGDFVAQGAAPAGDVVVVHHGSNLDQYDWSRRFGDASDQDPRGAAMDANKNLYIVGGLQGSANFGTGTLTSDGKSDVFIAKIAP